MPSHLMEGSGSGELKIQLDQALERNRSRLPPDAIVYELNDDRASRMRRISYGDTRSTCGEWWSKLTLSDRQAAEFVTEMRKLIARYGSGGNSRGGSYLVYLAIALK